MPKLDLILVLHGITDTPCVRDTSTGDCLAFNQGYLPLAYPGTRLLDGPCQHPSRRVAGLLLNGLRLSGKISRELR